MSESDYLKRLAYLEHESRAARDAAKGYVVNAHMLKLEAIVNALIDLINRAPTHAEIDALTAERDAARVEINQLRGWMAGYALIREQYAKEYHMRGESGKSNVSLIVSHDIADALNAFPSPARAALGESEATE